MTSDQKIINRLVRRIIKLVHPLRIILFGSAAKGTMHPDSDIDLLIVMKEGVHRRKTAQFLYDVLDHVSRPFDILVATPSDLEKYKNHVGLIYRTILKEGKEVYAA
jgi:uncharacterized protein